MGITNAYEGSYQMAGHLQAGLMDGSCISEPYSSAAMTLGTGFIAATCDFFHRLPAKLLFLEVLLAPQST